VRTGKDQEAIAAARKATELAPGYYGPYQTLGTIHFQKGRYVEAAEAFRKVTELAPAQPEGYASYGAALLVAEREPEAEKALRRSLELRETRTALGNLGVLLRYQHRDAEAVEIFFRALGLGAETSGTRLNLASTLKRLGRLGEAKPHFEKAAEIARAALLRNPRDASARASLAYAQVETGAHEAGLDNALQAARLDPNNYSVLFYTAMTMESLHKRELAVPLLSTATEQQLKDLRRQPDLQGFVNDLKYKALFFAKK
jgi:tetratricopeptide (TPR) repeat protein